jgi:beta-glucosidase
MITPRILLTAILSLATLAGCGQHTAMPATDAVVVETPPSDWPRLTSAVQRDSALETRVHEIVAGMTLAQKIGQMTQAEIKSITADQVRQYYIGSVLNGGGSWPGGNKQASVGDWLALAESYRDASLHTDATTPIPIIWGTDAVHGHGNVLGATLFPHNIGLGAANDPALIEAIAAATARAVRATGIDWVFAPTLAVAMNHRWGRSYESFGQDAELVRRYAHAYVRGMQGAFADGNTIATAKHFIGDGATENGTDQGIAKIDRDAMIRVHGAGYYGALEAGVQTVMASYNSWHDVAAGTDYGKMHGARVLLTDALKNTMGFDGFVVSDWNAIGQLPGCSNASCAASINAGIDMVMVPDDWKAFIANTIAQVESGEIAQARIDDAVSRIVRVKLRAGLFDHRPAQSRYAGDAQAIVDRALARRAVRQSLVLLKNDNAALPLKHGQRLLVIGKSADSIANQAGGWSLTWQGTDNTNADFPNADSVLRGLQTLAGADKVLVAPSSDGIDPATYDVIIAVIGETPYAETRGDIVPSATLRHSDRYPEDLAVLRSAAATGKPVVTVFIAGRALYANDLLNASSAFVAAWLPGTEGGGIADVLFAHDPTGNAVDFTGRLSASWPRMPCDAADASGDDAEHADVHECATPTRLDVFDTTDAPPFVLTLGRSDDSGDTRALGADLNAAFAWPDAEPILRVRTVQVNTQQDGKAIAWLAPARVFARSDNGNNLHPLAAADAALQFDIVPASVGSARVQLFMGCGHDCGAKLEFAGVLRRLPTGERSTVKVPLACFIARGLDVGGVDVPFGIEADNPFAAALADIRIVAGAGKDADAVACADLVP